MEALRQFNYDKYSLTMEKVGHDDLLYVLEAIYA